MEQIWFLAGGLLLGCLHALEADHIVTVTNLVLNKDSLKNSLRLALQWGLGHSLTLTTLAILVFSLDTAFMALMSTSAEQMVGATMIFLGMIVFYQELKQKSKLKGFDHKDVKISGPGKGTGVAPKFLYIEIYMSDSGTRNFRPFTSLAL